MRIRCGRIHIVPLVALVVGAAGWFTALAWGGEAGTAEFAETLHAGGDAVSGDMMN